VTPLTACRLPAPPAPLPLVTTPMAAPAVPAGPAGPAGQANPAAETGPWNNGLTYLFPDDLYVLANALDSAADHLRTIRLLRAVSAAENRL
jgi:hypothetical protein